MMADRVPFLRARARRLRGCDRGRSRHWHAGRADRFRADAARATRNRSGAAAIRGQEPAEHSQAIRPPLLRQYGDWLDREHILFVGRSVRRDVRACLQHGNPGGRGGIGVRERRRRNGAGARRPEREQSSPTTFKHGFARTLRGSRHVSGTSGRLAHPRGDRRRTSTGAGRAGGAETRRRPSFFVVDAHGNYHAFGHPAAGGQPCSTWRGCRVSASEAIWARTSFRSGGAP